MRIVALVLMSVLLAYAGLCAAVFAFQRSLIYVPQARIDNGPATTITLAVPGEKLVISVRPHPGTKALLYFGGNAEDVARSLPMFSSAFPEHAIYLLHYRSYGGSSGKPSEQALHADAQALFDSVRSQHADVTVIGRSLGSGVAIRLASLRPAARLILITPYHSLLEIAVAQYPWLPVRWLLADTFESGRYAPKITIPTLLVEAENDELIPHASTERLFTAFKPGIARRVIMPDAGHNSISNTPGYLDVLRAL